MIMIHGLLIVLLWDKLQNVCYIILTWKEKKSSQGTINKLGQKQRASVQLGHVISAASTVPKQWYDPGNVPAAQAAARSYIKGSFST